MARIRLFVDHPLGPGQSVPLTADQAHYLFSVMRLSVGAAVLLFNGHAGEWRAEIAEAGRRAGRLVCCVETRPLQPPPDLWLLFAPIKKARTDFIVEKATEMGAARILPVQTDFTNADRIRQDRLQAHAIEAAEQCGGTFVPEVCPLQPLRAVLDSWPQDRRLMWCDEHLADSVTAHGQTDFSPTAPTAPTGLAGLTEPWAIVIGPEGGFSEPEQNRLAQMPQVTRFRLGPRILRADTAAVAALALWQSALGDWA